MSLGDQDPAADVQPTPRPEDVDTGFWLWMVALVAMVVGYVVDLVTTPVAGPPSFVYAVSGVFVVVVASVVLAFLLLMRQGYRWALTVLLGGGAASVAFAVTNLLDEGRPPVPALIHAAAAIIGSVAIAGGAFLLHRKDAHAFFTR